MNNQRDQKSIQRSSVKKLTKLIFFNWRNENFKIQNGRAATH